MDDYLVVGLIGRAHGVRGEVSVQPRTDEPERRFAPGARLGVRTTRTAAPDAPSALTVIAARRHRDRLLVGFAELDDRDSAEAARGWELTVPIDPADAPADPEEFYDHQLVGLRVVDATGTERGTVVAVEHTGGQDLLHLEVDGATVLFPFVAALVPEVDLDGGRLVVDDRPGLLDATR